MGEKGLDLEKMFTMFEKKPCPAGESCGHAHIYHPFIGMGRCSEKTCSCAVGLGEGKAIHSTVKEETEPMATTAVAKSKRQYKINSTSKWHEKIQPLIDCGANRILFVGPPGTGKSKTATLLTGTVYRQTMTEGTGIEDLLGMYQLKNGETIWVDGPAVLALREGKALIIDEIDHHPQEIGSLLYALLDDAPQVMLPTGEVVTANEGYVVLATTNANINVLPEAIIDRFEAVLLATTPHPDALADMSKAEAACVANYYRALSTTPYKWAAKPTLRRMRAFSKFRKAKTFDEVVLADLVFGTSGKEVLSTLATSGI